MLRSCAAQLTDIRSKNCCPAVDPARATRMSPLATAIVVIAFAATAAAACNDPREHSPGEPWLPNSVGQLDGEAERILLADLAAARDAHADHGDPAQFSRDLAAAFGRYGLDLDTVDPQVVGARLGNRASTAQIASEIDHWSFIRRMRLERLDCRALANAARAIDLDPCATRYAIKLTDTRPTGSRCWADVRQTLPHLKTNLRRACCCWR